MLNISKYVVDQYERIQGYRLASLRYNQTMFLRLEYTTLCDLLAESRGVFEEAISLRTGSYLTLLPKYIGGDSYIRKNVYYYRNI